MRLRRALIRKQVRLPVYKLLGPGKKTDDTSRLGDILEGKRSRVKNLGGLDVPTRRPPHRCAFKNSARRLTCVCDGPGGGLKMGNRWRGPKIKKPIRVCGMSYTGTESTISCDRPAANLTQLPTALLGFKKLTRLSVVVNRLEDASLLRKLPTLTSLSIEVMDASSSVRGLSAVAGLKSLQRAEFKLRQARPRDLAALGQLTRLTRLTLGGPMRNFSFLSRLKVVRLSLNGSQIVNLAVLKGLSTLERLELRKTRVVDLAPLSALKRLKQLDLSGSRVVDLSPLGKLPELWILKLNSTPVRDLTPLYGLIKLWSLSAEKTRVVAIGGKSGWSGLEWLHLNDTAVGDISGLTDCRLLKHLYLNNTKVLILSPLAGMRQLETLSLDRTEVRHLTSLAGLVALRDLSLRQTKIRQLTSLYGLKRLRKVDLRQTPRLKRRQIETLRRKLPCNRQNQHQ